MNFLWNFKLNFTNPKEALATYRCILLVLPLQICTKEKHISLRHALLLATVQM